MALAAAIVATVVAGVGLLALFRPTPLPVPRAGAVSAPAAVPDLGDQAKRPSTLPAAKRS